MQSNGLKEIPSGMSTCVELTSVLVLPRIVEYIDSTIRGSTRLTAINYFCFVYDREFRNNSISSSGLGIKWFSTMRRLRYLYGTVLVNLFFLSHAFTDCGTNFLGTCRRMKNLDPWSNLVLKSTVEILFSCEYLVFFLQYVNSNLISSNLNFCQLQAIDMFSGISVACENAKTSGKRVTVSVVFLCAICLNMYNRSCAGICLVETILLDATKICCGFAIFWTPAWTSTFRCLTA